MQARSLDVVSLNRDALPNVWDVIALIFVFGVVSLIVAGSAGLAAPLAIGVC